MGVAVTNSWWWNKSLVRRNSSYKMAEKSKTTSARFLKSKKSHREGADARKPRLLEVEHILVVICDVFVPPRLSAHRRPSLSTRAGAYFPNLHRLIFILSVLRRIEWKSWNSRSCLVWFLHVPPQEKHLRPKNRKRALHLAHWSQGVRVFGRSVCLLKQLIVVLLASFFQQLIAVSFC